jgi:hypothetical protein
MLRNSIEWENIKPSHQLPWAKNLKIWIAWQKILDTNPKAGAARDQVVLHNSDDNSVQ